MRRWLAACAALALAAPAAAQDKPAWVGVWEGRVGTSPVRLCIDVLGSDGRARGSYYYLSRLEPISLSDDDSEGGWTEQAAGSDETALWEFAEQTGARLRGTWRQDRRNLPFELAPVAWSEGEWGGPCSSATFLEPRVRSPEFATEPATLEGWSFTRHVFVPPAHFANDVTIEAFSFANEQPGDAAINAVLAGYLPRGVLADEFVQCFSGAIASLGHDGYVEKTVRPMLVSKPFLAFDEANSDYCGGAHPNHWQVMRAFDRQSGEEIDLFDWLGEARIDGEDAVIADPVRELVFARWPAEEAECAEAATDTPYWSLGLARGGLIFMPDLPHVATACEARVTVEWRALEPFLDAEGRAGLARLQAE